MNDLLIFGGAAGVIIGAYLIMPAAAVVAIGVLLMVAGVVRMRGTHAD